MTSTQGVTLSIIFYSTSPNVITIWYPTENSLPCFPPKKAWAGQSETRRSNWSFRKISVGFGEFLLFSLCSQIMQAISCPHGFLINNNRDKQKKGGDVSQLPTLLIAIIRLTYMTNILLWRIRVLIGFEIIFINGISIPWLLLHEW